jgi:glycosyltransferase involved in cell wall biosynthesis
MKKKIVLLIPQLKMGGAERVVSRLSGVLKDIYDVRVVLFDSKRIDYNCECPIFDLEMPIEKDAHLFSKFLSSIKRINKYRKYKKDNQIDVTYSFGNSANYINVFSGMKDKKIVSLRGYARVDLPNNIKNKYLIRPISKIIYKLSDEIVCVSKLMADVLINQYGIQEKKVKTIYNAYDVSEITRLSNEKLETEENELFKNNKVIISAGTLRDVKGFWHLLKAFYLIKQTNNNVKLMILGSDYNNTKSKLLKLAFDLNIADDIIFKGFQKNPYKYISKSDLYVLSSVSEGFPNSMVEAMACKTFIIASDCKSGPREILDNKSNYNYQTETIEKVDNGILVAPMTSTPNYDKESFDECDKILSDAIRRCLNGEYNIEKTINNAYKKVNEFSFESWMKRNIDLIEGKL